LLKVETVKEEWKFVGENMAVFLTVKAEVDTGSIEKQLAKIMNDTSVQKNIKEQQSQIKELERKITNLQKHLGSADATKAFVLRKERNVTFKQIDALQEKKIKIITRIKKKTEDAKKIVTTGMTKSDVRSLLGLTDGEETKYADCGWWVWYYGTTQIYFNKAGIVCNVR